MTVGLDPATFCDGFRDRLVRALTLYCGDPWVAEELAQDALARAWERWPMVGNLDSPEAWTLRVATNLANSWFRRRSAERRARTRVAAGSAPSGDVATAVAVRDAVAALPPRQRAVVVARFFMDLSVEATASLVGCAEGTVRATTHQAIARLRSCGLGLDDERQEVR